MRARGENSHRDKVSHYGREERILTETRCHIMGERREFSQRQGVILWERGENSHRDKVSSYGGERREFSLRQDAVLCGKGENSH